MEEAIKLYQETLLSVEKICKKCNISKSRFYREKPKSIVRGHENQNRLYSFDLSVFKENSREKFYWLGFIGADGAIVNNTLSIELKSVDKAHLEKFNKWCKNTNPIKKRVNNSNCSCVKASINSKELVEYLKNYSIIQNKSSVFEMKGIPSQYVYDFIRGYMDGDGSVGIKDGQIYISFVSGSRTLLEQIENIIKTNNKINDYKTYYKITCLGNKKARAILDKVYENSTENTRLDRKYSTYSGIGPLLSD